MSEKIVESLSDYVDEINTMQQNLSNKVGVGKKENIYYRGQNQDFSNTLPSLIRNENYLNNEDKLINDFITKYPELFGDCHNNFDRLALMQHHQLPTRLLDLTSNPLVALYFAVERSDNGTEKGSDGVDGKIFPFTKFDDQKPLRQSLSDEGVENIYKEYTAISGKDNQFLKSPFSDEIEIESSLARLSNDDRKGVLNALDTFYKELSGIDIVETWWWSVLYGEIATNSEQKHDLNNFSKKYEKFNSNASVGRLYHEIRRDIGDFEKIINPLELFVPKIVTPRIIDQRIRNQKGLFLFVPFVPFVPFVKKYRFTECGGQVALDLKKVREQTQKRIDILRLLDSQGEKPITFVVPKAAKESIRSELKTMGITESFIYPDPSHIASEIAGDY